MANSPADRSALVQVALGLKPSLIRKALLDDAHFRDEFGLKRDRLLVFDDSGPSIQRSELNDAIRQALSGGSELKVTDTDGRDWQLVVERDKSQSTTLTITYNDHQIPLLPHATLSADRNVRLHSINEIARDFNLPCRTLAMWRDIVAERALDDDEVDEFYYDFCDTPIHSERSIRGAFQSGEVSVSSLVPCSRRYYDRLVGAYDGSTSIKDYASGGGKQFFVQLSSWRPYDGFLFSLLLSSHSSLTAEISVETLGKSRSDSCLRLCGRKWRQYLAARRYRSRFARSSRKTRDSTRTYSSH